MATTAVQIIDEHKKFSDGAAAFLSNGELGDVGINYHLISVFGSQSSGKSTLLNALFDTKFGVMDTKSRGQTTHGIWLGKANHQVETQTGDETSQAPVLVLDVEGTDGRERGEDQDFERKAALFALASSEVLIVNMWENQIGLYLGSNLALLKTVFEVNLSLFQTSGVVPRSRIMFVIRDHTSDTTIESLADPITEDLNKFWQEIAKPNENLEKSTLNDFFDVSFVSLPHMRLEREKFDLKIADLKNWFYDPSNSQYVFDKQYHRRVPLDGWPVYASNIWGQIEENKDLDLPTQQILVARYRCNEIAEEAWRLFENNLEATKKPFGSSEKAIVGFGSLVRPALEATLELYTRHASKYNKGVYEEQKQELINRIGTTTAGYLRAHLRVIQNELLNSFETSVTFSGESFAARVSQASAAAQEGFASQVEEAQIELEQCTATITECQASFAEALDRKAADLRASELSRIVAQSVRSLKPTLTEEVGNIVAKLQPGMWEEVQTTVSKAMHSTLSDSLESTGAAADVQDIYSRDFVVKVWELFEDIVRDLTSTKNTVLILNEHFEREFMYGSGDSPIIWTPSDDIKSAYIEARDKTLALLPLLSKAVLSSGEPLERPAAVQAQQRDSELDLSNLISPLQQDQISAQLRKKADQMYISTERSVTQTAVHIPRWVYILIIVLGWNEFMAVLRNPLLFLLFLLMGGGILVLWQTELMGPATTVAKATFDKVEELVREQLRTYLLEGSVANATKSRDFDADAIELDDLKFRARHEDSAIAEEDDSLLSEIKPPQPKERRRSSMLRGPSNDMLASGNKLSAANRRGSSSLSATNIPHITEDAKSATMNPDVKLATGLRKFS